MSELERTMAGIPVPEQTETQTVSLSTGQHVTLYHWKFKPKDLEGEPLRAVIENGVVKFSDENDWRGIDHENYSHAVEVLTPASGPAHSLFNASGDDWNSSDPGAAEVRARLKAMYENANLCDRV